jgi:hypothetical protein
LGIVALRSQLGGRIPAVTDVAERHLQSKQTPPACRPYTNYAARTTDRSLPDTRRKYHVRTASCVRWVRALRYRSLTRIGWPSSCCLDQPVLARRFWPSSITSPTKGPNIYLINAPWVAFMDRCDLACSFLLKWNDRNKKKAPTK